MTSRYTSPGSARQEFAFAGCHNLFYALNKQLPYSLRPGGNRDE